MKILNIFTFMVIVALSFNSYSELKAQKTTYETVPNDPTGLRLYTLENGLKVYLSKNTDEPKIQTFIAVRAGSNYDPKEATGLAHYLEHMVFKGTSKFGTANWEKEKEYLTQISDLYEKHKAETDPEKKKAIYKQIDEVSLEASKYAVANEYDKAVASLGATGTNAHTWFEETVYKNKIPANELEKWLGLETERFSELVLRLFHTELEAVFEEFNRGQDNDYRKQYAAMLEGLFPTHPYGQQSTIGTSEHLKNPSMIAIHNYFKKYYVPNNMALVLVGDLDFDETIKMVEKTMGTLKHKEVTHPVLPKEKPITKPIIKEVFGPTAESISVAFRSQGIGTKEGQLLTMADMLLANGTAGLIDLNLNQKQVVQRASCSPTLLNDYGYHSFTGTPKANQTLDEVKGLLLGEIENLKQGKFEDWMLEAVINDLELSQTQQYENSSALASAYYNAFIHHEEWKNKVSFISDLRKITKQEIMDFAKAFYKENYVVTYKRKGEDKTISKVENPGITPVELNRDKQSTYIAEFNKIKSKSISPVFIDYDKKIKKMKLDNGLELSYIENETNDLFDLNIILDMGKNNIKKLSHAVSYLKYVGTDKYSPEEIQKEFYKLGVSYGVFAGGERSYVYISGIKKNLDKGLELFEHLLNNAVANQGSYDKYVAKILKGRENNKTQKGRILWSGLFNYGKYGEESEARNLFSAEELKKINPKELVELVKGLTSYKQRLFYYGTGVQDAVTALNKHHKTPKKLNDYPKAKEFKELETGKKVYFVDYDMVQSEMIFLAKKDKFDVKKMALARVFNSYFGSGLSSIVFQEIRESKSLAYSAFASYSTAGKKDKSDYVFAYVGTQANKLPQAVDAMLDLMNDMPKAEKQFLAAKEATLKKIAAERITKSSIFWNYQSLQDKGIDSDIRKEVYDEVQKITMEDLAKFFNENIKGGNYTILVIGNKKDMQMDALKKLGEVKELEIDYLFNY